MPNTSKKAVILHAFGVRGGSFNFRSKLRNVPQSAACCFVVKGVDNGISMLGSCQGLSTQSPKPYGLTCMVELLRELHQRVD